MPSSITHELIAAEAEEQIPAGAREIARTAPDYYFLGAQGPDLFFFYRPFARREENLGRRLHRRQIYDWFTALMKALPEFTGEEFGQCLAYALGFCSHLAADVTFHPFIYNYLKENDPGRMTHQQIENDWDVYFLRELKGQSVLRYRYPFDLKAIAQADVLFRYLSRTGERIGIPFRAGAFRRMIRNFSRYLTHFHKGGVKVLRPFGLAAFYPRSAPEPTFLCGERFYALSEGRGNSADELFLYAVRESAACIEAFLEAFNTNAQLPRALFSRNLLSGREAEEEKPRS